MLLTEIKLAPPECETDFLIACRGGDVQTHSQFVFAKDRFWVVGSRNCMTPADSFSGICDDCGKCHGVGWCWLRQQRLTGINLQTPHPMSIFISQKNHYPLGSFDLRAKMSPMRVIP
jgi:hypothetical protein